MKAYFKYLILGWSIVSVGLIVLAYQIIKKDIIQENYEIRLPEKIPDKLASQGFTFLGTFLYHDLKCLSKKEFTKRLKDAKEIDIYSSYKIKEPKAFYILFPIYAFLIWALPIIVFSLLGLVFKKK